MSSSNVIAAAVGTLLLSTGASLAWEATERVGGHRHDHACQHVAYRTVQPQVVYVQPRVVYAQPVYQQRVRRVTHTRKVVTHARTYHSTPVYHSQTMYGW